MIQPSPYGDSLTSCGAPSRSPFTATTSPDRGANRSLAALTLSITPNGLPWVIRLPISGSST